MQAIIKSVEQDENKVVVTVEFDTGKSTVSKTYNYTSGNLDNKQQVLDNIKNELQGISGFTAVVEDLKAQIDIPIEASLEVVDG